MQLSTSGEGVVKKKNLLVKKPKAFFRALQCTVPETKLCPT